MNPEVRNYEYNQETLRRLNELTDNDTAREYLMPALANLAMQDLPTEEFVGSMIEEVSGFAKEHLGDMQTLALNQVPEYIDVLVDDEDSNRAAKTIWESFVEEQKGYPEITDMRLPRKLKKALNKAPDERRPGERGMAEKFARRQNRKS